MLPLTGTLCTCVRASGHVSSGARMRRLRFAPNPEWSDVCFLGSLMLTVRKHCLLSPVALP